MKKYRPFVAIVWICLGLFLMYFSCRLGLGKLQNPGAGLMPFLIGAFMSLASACLLVVGLLNGVHEAPAKEQGKVDAKKVCRVAILLVLYGLLLERLGFPLTTFLLLAFLFRVMALRWTSAFLSSALTVTITYVSFTYLGVRLPAGIFRVLGL